IGRKTLLQAGPGRRLMIKGHFLAAAQDLSERYPDARFLTVIRSPERRIQSIVNFLRAQPRDPIAAPVPRPWLVAYVLVAEVEYCEAEMEWYRLTSDTRRCVVRFDDYVRDLAGTMSRVYRECLDIEELPAHVPRVHAPR